MNPQPVSLADRDLLAGLVTEIVWRIDHGHADTVHELFVPDGTLTLGPTRLEGRDEIAEWGRQRVAAAIVTRHVCTNSRFVEEANGAAKGTTYLTVYQGAAREERSTIPLAVGEYRDEFVCTDAGWRFRSRYSDAIFLRTA